MGNKVQATHIDYKCDLKWNNDKNNEYIDIDEENKYMIKINNKEPGSISIATIEPILYLTNSAKRIVFSIDHLQHKFPSQMCFIIRFMDPTVNIDKFYEYYHVSCKFKKNTIEIVCNPCNKISIEQKISNIKLRKDIRSRDVIAFDFESINFTQTIVEHWTRTLCQRLQSIESIILIYIEDLYQISLSHNGCNKGIIATGIPSRLKVGLDVLDKGVVTCKVQTCQTPKL